jgi:hypothetical protein
MNVTLFSGLINASFFCVSDSLCVIKMQNRTQMKRKIDVSCVANIMDVKSVEYYSTGLHSGKPAFD